MQFEVKGQVYFLNFVAQEGRWSVFQPSSLGMMRIPVYEDGFSSAEIPLDIPQPGTSN